jgi:hypothetical protein
MTTVKATAPTSAHSNFQAAVSESGGLLQPSGRLSRTCPSLLAITLRGAPDKDRACQGASNGTRLPLFGLDGDDSIKGSHLSNH